jgi:Uma2 family endonuclease
MATILEQPEIRNRARGMTVSAYHRLIELGEIQGRVELIEGFVVEKMSKSPLHRFVVRALVRLLEAYCRSKQLLVFKEEPLTLESSEPEPDVAIVVGIEEDFADAHPSTALLVVEVAISSVSLDQAKAESYARAEVNEYWVIRPEDEVIEVYREPVNGAYQSTSSIRIGNLLQSTALNGFSLRLGDLLPK